MSPLSENESPPAAPSHSCIRVMLRAALLIVLRPRYNPAAILSSFPPVRCMIKKFLPIPLFSLDERGGCRLRTGASDIFFDKKYPRLPEIVAGEGVTRRLIDAPRAPPQSQLFYENGIPRRRRPQVINPSNTPLLCPDRASGSRTEAPARRTRSRSRRRRTATTSCSGCSPSSSCSSSSSSSSRPSSSSQTGSGRSGGRPGAPAADAASTWRGASSCPRGDGGCGANVARGRRRELTVHFQ